MELQLALTGCGLSEGAQWSTKCWENCKAIPQPLWKEQLLLVKKLLRVAHRQEGRREPSAAASTCQAACSVHTDGARRSWRASPCTAKQNTQGQVWSQETTAESPAQVTDVAVVLSLATSHT